MRKLRNSNLDITEDDIKVCNDPVQLMEWKLGIGRDLLDITSQINLAKAKASHGEKSDPTWFANIHGAKKCQGMLDQLIQHRLRVLKEVQRDQEREQAEDRWKWFVEIAARELPEKTFKSLLRKSENAAKKAEKVKQQLILTKS